MVEGTPGEHLGVPSIQIKSSSSSSLSPGVPSIRFPSLGEGTPKEYLGVHSLQGVLS